MLLSHLEKTSPHKNQKIFNCPKKKEKYSPIRLLNQYKEGKNAIWAWRKAKPCGWGRALGIPPGDGAGLGGGGAASRRAFGGD
jgi:hypothetical protein